MPIQDQASSFSFYLQPAAPGSPGSSIFDLPVERAPAPPVLPPPEPSKDLGNVEAPRQPASDSSPSYVLVSGGTGGNAICSGFGDACFVLPVSDDGGSSSEIIRVLGGPSVGDIRSRLVRLIPHASEASPLAAIRTLLAYRLPAKCSEKEARDEWRDIVEGRSALWTGIPSDRKETIRGFLVHFESQLLTRAHKNFDFRNGSIGNYFIAGAQNFFRSLPSSIFLFSSITNSQAHILPVIITNHIVTLAAELEDGQRLMGQCEISHPISKPRDPSVGDLAFGSFEEPDDTEELEHSAQNVLYERVEQDTVEGLSARISRIFYMNSYGMEIHPSPNPEFLSNLKSKTVLVYSCGSLWTSIMPCLALRGVATAIASSYSLRAKVLLLNCENDRETEDYTAIDYINAIVRTLNSEYSKPRYGLGNAHTIYPPSAFITDLVYLSDTKISIDEAAIAKLGIKCTVVQVDNRVGEKASGFEGEALRGVLDGIYLDRRQE